MLKNKNYSAEKIKEIIESVNEENSSYYYYFGKYNYGSHHLGLKSELKSYIEKKILDKKFVLETLNQPTEIKQSLYGGEPATCFLYPEIGVRIYFNYDIAIGYDEY